ncbi:hypothetical protein D3C80_1588170 [compost metagenome]
MYRYGFGESRQITVKPSFKLVLKHNRAPFGPHTGQLNRINYDRAVVFEQSDGLLHNCQSIYIQLLVDRSGDAYADTLQTLRIQISRVVRGGWQSGSLLVRLLRRGCSCHCTQQNSCI